ncbi:hypothetical protein AMTR_s00116p00142000 [Amborella trichopoda]|uniref:Uncharacterized protein n=1 Tax=Amborella trichopoda TaxID=13333 RepID=W1NSL5_AMBTC|nr:hypothetical protein AMTR_s00116p00142000 [Amborella trichopoda]
MNIAGVGRPVSKLEGIRPLDVAGGDMGHGGSIGTDHRPLHLVAVKDLTLWKNEILAAQAEDLVATVDLPKCAEQRLGGVFRGAALSCSFMRTKQPGSQDARSLVCAVKGDLRLDRQLWAQRCEAVVQVRDAKPMQPMRVGEGSLVLVCCASITAGGAIGAWCWSTKAVRLGWISLSGAEDACGSAWCGHDSEPGILILLLYLRGVGEPWVTGPQRWTRTQQGAHALAEGGLRDEWAPKSWKASHSNTNSPWWATWHDALVSRLEDQGAQPDVAGASRAQGWTQSRRKAGRWISRLCGWRKSRSCPLRGRLSLAPDRPQDLVLPLDMAEAEASALNS